MTGVRRGIQCVSRLRPYRMALCFVMRLLLSPAFLLGAGLIYLVVRITSRWRNFQRLTQDVPGPAIQSPYYGHLLQFNAIGSFQDLNHHIVRTFDRYGRAFKLWMGHELWLCVADNELAKEILEFPGSYPAVPSYNFFSYAKEFAYRKKTRCPFYTRPYEANPKPTVHQDRVEQATRDLVEELKAKAGGEAISHADLKQAIQACMKRCFKDIDWQLQIKEQKNRIYFPFQDRIDMWLVKIDGIFTKYIHERFYISMGNEYIPECLPTLREDTRKLYSMSFEKQEKASSLQSKLSTRDLNINIPEGPESHLSGEISEHFATQLSECVEESGLLLVNLLQDVAAHPEVLARLRAEAERVWGSAAVPTLSAERQLVYTEMVIKEALRLYSPPGFFFRAGKTFTRGKIVVPEGCLTYISAEHIHSNFEFYERAISFYPEHFSDERLKTAPGGSFFPLPLEPPFCTDDRLVLKLMKIILSTLVRHFSLETNTHPDSIQHNFFQLHENLKTINLKSKPL